MGNSLSFRKPGLLSLDFADIQMIDGVEAIRVRHVGVNGANTESEVHITLRSGIYIDVARDKLSPGCFKVCVFKPSAWERSYESIAPNLLLSIIKHSAAPGCQSKSLSIPNVRYRHETVSQTS